MWRRNRKVVQIVDEKILRTAAMMAYVFCDTLQDVEECIAKEELQTGIKYIRRTTTAGFATDGIERFSES